MREHPYDDANKLDDSCAAELRAAPTDITRRALATANMTKARNPSAFALMWWAHHGAAVRGPSNKPAKPANGGPAGAGNNANNASPSSPSQRAGARKARHRDRPRGGAGRGK